MVKRQKFVHILILGAITFLMSACVPKATEKKATCGADQAFSNISRSCQSLVTNHAPVAVNITPVAFLEGAPSVIILSYTDPEITDLATNCQLTNLNHVTVTQACACDGVGSCTVGVTGTTDYYGAASFSYTVKANGQTSNTATANFTITNVNDVPTISAIAAQSTTDKVAKVVDFTIDDVDSTVTCAGVVATSADTTRVPNANLAITTGSSSHNCVLTITPVQNQTLVAAFNITLNLSDSSAGAAVPSVFALTLTPVNDAPTFNPSIIPTPAAINEGGTATVTFTLTDLDLPALASCATAGILTYTSSDIGTIISNIVFTDAAAPSGNVLSCSAAISLIANANTVTNGPVNITFVANDLSGSATATTTLSSFALTVNSVNDEPAISSLTPASATVSENSTSSPQSGGYIDVAVLARLGGGETTQILTLTATSLNTTLLPSSKCQNYTLGQGIPGSGGSGAPGSTPSAAGLYYFDRTNYVCYVSSGTAWSYYPSLTVFPKCGSYDYSGLGIPSISAGTNGTHYLDTTNNKCYISNGTAWSAATAASVTNFYVSYTLNSNQSAGAAALIALSLTDDGGTANGGDNTAATQNFTLTVTAVNDPPYFATAPTSVQTNEGGVVVAGPFYVDEDEGSTTDENSQYVKITAVSSDNQALLPTTTVLTANDSITAFYDLNDDGFEKTTGVAQTENETRVLNDTLEAASSDNAKLHPLYFKLKPIAGVAGNANITVTINDGTNSKTKTFSLIVNPVAALHGGWANISSVGIKTDKNGDPASINDVSCNYNKSTDIYKCDTPSGNCTKTTPPDADVTPTAPGVIYYDSGSKRCYYGRGADKFSWIEIKKACPITRVSVASTTLQTTDLTTGSTTMTVASTTGYPPAGTLTMGAEQIAYTGKTATTFTGLTRAATPYAHLIASSAAAISPTTLTVALTSSATSMTVTSTTAFGATGTVTIDSEQISYTAKTATTFTGLTRGINSTTAAAHTNSSSVQATADIVAYTDNGKNFIKDASTTPASALPTPTATAANQYYLDMDASPAVCYKGVETTTPGNYTFTGATAYQPAKVTLTWNAFTIAGSGPDTAVQIAGWNVYRRIAGADYDFTNGFLKTVSTDTKSISSVSTRTFTDTTAVAGTVYYYTVRPVDSIHSLSTYTPEIFSEVRVLAPMPNYAFVHRWMVNQEVCNSMHMTTTTTNKVDPSHNYRCPYSGPGQVTISAVDYYDIGKDMLVDIAESGCPYTKAPSCDAVNGCVGIGSPNGSVTSGAAGKIYYDRNDGSCYVSTNATTAWTAYNSAAVNASLVDQTNTALNPPLVNINQAKATALCAARTTTTATTGLSASPAAALPSKIEYIAYSAAPYGMSDTNITDMEEGFSLNVQSRCNSSSANGVDTAFTDSTVPSTSFTYSIPGTGSSGIRSIFTGSVPWGSNYSTETCSSRYGVQDVYGNVAEWVTDEMTCDGTGGTYVCNGTAGALSALSFGGFAYKLDNVIGPYYDLNADNVVGAGDSFLGGWDLRDELYGANKFSFPIGMPISINIPSAYDAYPYILDIGPTSGITTSQLHEDRIDIYGGDIALDPSDKGSFVQGGSFLTGTSSGRYFSELIPDATVGAGIGFRCYIPISSGNFPADTKHLYSY